MNETKNKLATISIPCRFSNEESYISYDDENFININPLTILGDFCTYFSYNKISEYEQDNYILNNNYKEHPFLAKSHFSYSEKIMLNVALITLLDFINSKNKLDIRDFEIIKQFHKLTFDFKILFKKENPLYSMENKIEIKNNHPEISNDIDIPYQWETLSVRRGITFNDIENEMHNDNYRFEYTCYSINDMIFSVLHYLVFFGYKFAKCDHCQKYFAVKSYKTKLCTRKSPYINYTKYDCKKAVHVLQTKFRNKFNIMEQKMMKNKNISEKTLSEYRHEYEKLYYKNYNEMQTDINIKKIIVSSINDLKKLEDFLYDKNK